MSDDLGIVQPEVPANPRVSAEVMTRVSLSGDLADLNDAQRAEYYAAVCRSLGLNPLTKPFEFLTLNGKLRLYALRDCADQLRRIHGISIYIANRERVSDVYVVTARAKDRTGREDESTGAVPLGNLKGDAFANALMKAETKAKRRVTLSIAGLGWLDEMDMETIPESHILATTIPQMPVATHPATPEQEPPREQGRTAAPESSGPKLTAKEVDELLSCLGRAYESDERAWAKVREVMNIPAGQDFTRARVRLQLTRAQHDHLKASAEQALKDELKSAHPDDAVGDFSAPGGSEPSGANQEATSSPIDHTPATDTSDATMNGPAQTPAPESAGTAGGTGHEGKYASQAQKDELKALASQISPDEAETVRKSIDRHRHGLPLEIYEMARTRLKTRLAQEAATEA